MFPLTQEVSRHIYQIIFNPQIHLNAALPNLIKSVLGAGSEVGKKIYLNLDLGGKCVSAPTIVFREFYLICSRGTAGRNICYI